ncbi:MAG: hypothetical protein M1820_010053 [Bogoriella megaspora]|nr:MAG: hypothetical protein M1820_010053 [Bogoriella megaspora]
MLDRQTEATSATHSNAELIERIERLEDIVLRQSASSDSHPTRNSALGPNSGDAVTLDIHQKRDEDSDVLENVGTREDLLLSSLSNGITFRICTTQEILETRNLLQHPMRNLEYDRLSDTVITFPIYRVAVLLLQSYESNVDHVCRILHIPTIRSLIQSVYLQLSQGKSIPPGQAALILSIFAIAAFFYQPSGISEVATSEQDIVHLSKFLAKNAVDLLDYSRRSTSGTLEDVQAYILMTFVTFHLDGFSARGRLFMTAAASIARDLRLHRLDANFESSTESGIGARGLIDREVKRRVFWYIASLQSTISGPQEGMYFIHPNHISVRLPKDCSDDDLVFGEASESMLGSQPTGMNYFLERIRLAHLCREMVDTVPLDTCKLEQTPYEYVIALDKKLVDFISSLPFFFKLDAESRKQALPLETMYPNIPLLRYCITRAAHSRRCRLHQRFLLRQSSDLRFAYSRQACVESARTVLQFYEDLSGNGPPRVVTARMGIAVHFMYLALVVLVMDLCFNRNEADEAEIKAEVKAALQMFENNKYVSPLLSRFASSLYHILQKHNVCLADPVCSIMNEVADSGHVTDTDAFDLPEEHQMQSTQFDMDLDLPGVNFDVSFDEFWQSAIEGEPDLDLLAWDNLFSSLDSRPL